MTVPAAAGSWAGPYDVLEEVRRQIVAVLPTSGARKISTSYVANGQVAWDDVCGSLIVGHEAIYRTTDFPLRQEADETCWGGTLALRVVVFLLRCVPVLGADGRAPTAAALDAAHRAILGDVTAVWMACQDLASPVSGEEWQTAGLASSAIGAEGGGAGEQFSFLLGLDQELWCPDG